MFQNKPFLKVPQGSEVLKPEGAIIQNTKGDPYLEGKKPL